MSLFRPEEILRSLERQKVRYVLIGGLAATYRGSPLLTRDADICPARDLENLGRLAEALQELGARITAPDVPEGLPFACDAQFLSRNIILNLTTRHGPLDLSFQPAGTAGYEDLVRNADAVDVGEGLVVRIAALEDIIRSKEAANRPKDHLTLPTLKVLLEEIRRQREP